MADDTVNPEKRLAMAKRAIAKFTAENDDQLAERINTLRSEFSEELDGLSDAQTAFSPGEGQWSVSEVCRHVAQSQAAVANISQSLADGNVPEQTGETKIGLMTDDPGSPAGLNRIVAESFVAAAQAAERQRSECNLETVFPHPWFGERNSREWVAFNILHMRVHIKQIRRVKNTDGFPGS